MPIVVALDEKGVVRHVNPRPRGFLEKFLAANEGTTKRLKPPKPVEPAEIEQLTNPRIDKLRKAVASATSDDARRDALVRLGDEYLIWSGV